MYLAGIIPGPTEPSGDQLNHFLEPLIDELIDSWERGFSSPILLHREAASLVLPSPASFATFQLLENLPSLPASPATSTAVLATVFIPRHLAVQTSIPSVGSFTTKFSCGTTHTSTGMLNHRKSRINCSVPMACGGHHFGIYLIGTLRNSSSSIQCTVFWKV